MKEALTCPVCFSKEVGLYWEHVWMSGNQRVFLCKDCELYYLHPLLTEEGQKTFNDNYNVYIQKRESLVADFSESSFSEQVDESITVRFKDVEKYFCEDLSVLEIGSEHGGFLDTLKRRFPSTSLTAVDACPEYEAHLQKKGYPTYSYLEDIPRDQKFDRICFFSLLEHIPDPLNFLKIVREHLNVGGYALFEVPFSKDPLISLYNIDAFKSFYFQGMHPYVFSEKSLELLLKKSSFSEVSFQYKQRYGIDNHLQWMKAGLPGGNTSFKESFSEDFQEKYLRELESKGLCDTIYVKAQ